MIRVIQHGNPEKNTEQRVICNNCMCEFTLNNSDLIKRIGTVDEYYVPCPDCRQLIQLSPK